MPLSTEMPAPVNAVRYFASRMIVAAERMRFMTRGTVIEWDYCMDRRGIVKLSHSQQACCTSAREHSTLSLGTSGEGLMFRIRQVPDDTASANRVAVQQAQEILRTQLPELDPEQIARIPEELSNPMRYGFRAVLFVAEDGRDQVRGEALLLHSPRLSFCYLEYLSAAPGTTSRGVGGALYERVREQAKLFGALGIFYECLPDYPLLSPTGCSAS